MKNLILFVFVLAFAANTAKAVESKNNDALIGEWKYNSPSAQEGYETGMLVFSEKEDKLTGYVKYNDGTTVEFKNITYQDGDLKLGLYIDYEYINVKAKIDGETLMGVVTYPDGEMKFTANKVK